jgi:hypothetical protein
MRGWNRKWNLVKRTLAPYSSVVGAGYGAFAAIRQAQHPTVDAAGWLLWTGAVLTTLLFLMLLMERAPTISMMVYRAINRSTRQR